MTKDKKIEVRFEAGGCRDPFKGSCNYMLATITGDDSDNGELYPDEVELYAEVPIKDSPFNDSGDGDDFDWNGFDDYSYPILKAEITRQAVENGIDPTRLKFHWD